MANKKKSSGGTLNKPVKKEVDLNWFKLPALLAILVITIIVYLPGIHNQLTNWDDDGYVYSNDLVKSPMTLQNAKRFFTEYSNGNYHPLALLSLKFDNAIYGLP